MEKMTRDGQLGYTEIMEICLSMVKFIMEPKKFSMINGNQIVN